MSLKFISIPPKNNQPPENLLVMLHGWGANAQDLAPLTPMLDLPKYQCIFPEAPFAHPEVPGGKAWYALETNDYQGLTESREILISWLQSLESSTGVPLSKTVLAGFSQGGAMTLDVGLRLSLLCLCSLSGYLHAQPQQEREFTPPILIVHGRQDLVVPLRAAQKAEQELSKLGLKVHYQEYDMGHEIIPQEVDLLRNFILAS